MGSSLSVPPRKILHQLPVASEIRASLSFTQAHYAHPAQSVKCALISDEAIKLAPYQVMPKIQIDPLINYSARFLICAIIPRGAPNLHRPPVKGEICCAGIRVSGR